MQLNKNIKIAGGFATAAVLWMLTGAFSAEEQPAEQIKLKTVKVLANTISSENYIPKVEIVGRTAVADEVDLVAEVSGKVEKILFEQGDYVKEGDLMLTLENDYRKDNFNSAKEELDSATLKLNIAKNLAKQAYKAKTDLADRQAEYTRAISNLTNAKRDYENSFVHAPIAGFVEEKNVSHGDYVQDDTVLYKIISQDEMYLVGYLSQNQIAKVKLGQKAYGIFNNGKKAEGVVSFIAQKADQNTKTYKMEITIKLESDVYKVREGLTVKVFIPSEEVPVYKIPHSAVVIADDGRVGIRVVDENNIVKFLETSLIEDTHSHQLVQTTTHEDLNLIVRGQIDVQDGMVVETSFSDEKDQEETKK